MSDWAHLRPWLVVALTAWLAVGVLIVDWANRRGLIDDINFSPYHAVGYAALAVLGAYVIWRVLAGLRRGGWRTGFAPGYDGLAVGFFVLAAWVVLDLAWQETLGIGFGFENAVAPTRLMVPLAVGLLATGPVRDALAKRSRGPGGRAAGMSVVGPAVAALGLIGSAVTLTALNPVREPLNDYVTNQGVDNSEIWLMGADGSSQQRLVRALGDGIDFSLPVWSPDGERIAFTAWTNASGLRQNWQHREQTSAIWTMAADGSDRRLVADGAPHQAWIPAWSPDGAWLAWTLSPTGPAAGGSAAAPAPEPGPVGPAVSNVGARTWIAHPDGSAAVELAGEATSAVWSPDGTRMAYIRGAQDGADVFVATFVDRRVTDERAVAPAPGEDWGPAFSPDGSRLAFTSTRAGSDDIWVVDVDGGGLTQLTFEPGMDGAPAWSPDGSTIAFVSDRTGDSEVWTMAASGERATNLTTDPSAVDGQWSVAWSPDGSRLVYARASFQPESASGYVRWELMTAENVLLGLVLSAVALVLVALGAPAGGFTAVLAIMTTLAVLSTEEWRFIPGAIVAGAFTDLAVRVSRPSSRARVAATAFPASAVLAFGFTMGLAGTLTWSLTMLLGVATAVALLGFGLAAVVEVVAPGRIATEREAPSAQAPTSR